MIYGICNLSIVPVRASNNDCSEITTQLIFGEKLIVLKKYKQWRKIKIKHDNYIGWIDKKQFLKISKTEYLKSDHSLFFKQASIKLKTLKGSQNLVRGTILDLENKILFGNKKNKLLPIEKKHKTSIKSIAKSYLNTPYLWGGRTPYGIDCSGFTQIVYRFKGIYLHRDASKQVNQGKKILFKNIKKNDLVFFMNKNKKIHHVGIYLGNKKIIHAHGKVRIDRLTNKGIINSKKLSHMLYDIRRLDF